jgi:hypothetical protein
MSRSTPIQLIDGEPVTLYAFSSQKQPAESGEVRGVARPGLWGKWTVDSGRWTSRKTRNWTLPEADVDSLGKPCIKNVE